MLLTRIIPRKFSSRLLLMTLFTGLIPVIIFTFLIQTSGDRFKNEINQTVQSGRDQEWKRSEAFLRQQGEEQICAKAIDVALQLNLALRIVPWMTLEDLQRDGKFHEVAVQRVGRIGYTTLYETRTGISRFHRDRKYENVKLRRFSKSLPAFWAIVRKSLTGKSAGGYYDWKEPDGSVRQKYMYAVPLTTQTGDGVRLSVAATAYVGEFTQPVREAEAIHQDTTRLLMGTIGASIGAFQKTGLFTMGLGIVVASLLALCVGRYFSRTIGRIREATSRVNAGDYAIRVRSSMSGEMGTLVADFNTMVAQLEATTVSKHRLEESEEKLRQTNTELLREVAERTKAEGALKEARSQLERRVEERTDELQQAYAKLVEEIKEREQLEAQLRQAQKMEAIGTLAGGIAHDFNNMLAAIIGFSEIIEEDLPKDSLSVHHIQSILGAASRGRDLVKQILAFSRKTEHVRGALSLSPLIKETIQLLRVSLPTTIAIRLHLNTAEDTVLASPAEIQQILMNLVINAAFAMHDSGGTLTINLANIDFKPDSSLSNTDVEPGEYVQLVVTDTGSGMTPDVMKRVFDPFFTTKKVGEGTGMGLSVVYGIVKSLHGVITVKSRPGVGSIFKILLPKSPVDMTSEPVKAEATPTGNERILFIDDEELLVEWGQTFLEKLGYAVKATTVSAEALKVFSSDPSQFDLVISDQSMPGITGLHLARKLLKIRSNIPIILCTGYSDSVSPEKAKEAGIKEFLMKPLGKKELAEVIRRVLDTAESKRLNRPS